MSDFDLKTMPANVPLFTQYPAAFVGQRGIQSMLAQVTIASELHSFTLDSTASPYPYWIGRKGYPHPGLNEKPYIEGRANEMDFTNIDPKPASSLLQRLQRTK